MHRFVARANVDHFLELLNGSDITSNKRGVVTRLLIAEADKLGQDLEHLKFAEGRAARGRERVDHLRSFRETFALGTPKRDQADRLLADIENLQSWLEAFCHRLRERVNSRDT